MPWKTIEGNLEDIEDYLWEMSLAGTNQYARYLYCFKEDFCVCRADENDTTEDICTGGEPTETHSFDPDFELEWAF